MNLSSRGQSALVLLSGARSLEAGARSLISGSATADIPDFFFSELAAAGPGAREKLTVMMSEGGLSTTAGHHAKGLIQWEPENYPGDGFAVQTPAAINWWRFWEKDQPYTSLGDYYAAVFLPNRRLHPLADGSLTHAGESFYENNRLLDQTGDGRITKEDLEAFALRPEVVSSRRYQEALQRLASAGADITPMGTRSIGGFPWLLTGTLVLLGIGGTMLLAEKKIVTLPKWVPV
jgi:hypothetical protein